ncbi:MAG TPA: hypothetical protein VEA37_12220 [Flavobacterium sp.]|nr:hypothetical protein [Flavobacterium sp.]
MTRYFNHPEQPYRVRIKYREVYNHFGLQVQKKWLFIWFDVGKWMTVKEGFWGENWNKARNPLVLDYSLGNIHECWKTGTLDLLDRARIFLIDYFCDMRRKQLKPKIHAR